MRLMSLVGLLGVCWEAAAWRGRRTDELEALLQETKPSETVTMSSETGGRIPSGESMAAVVIPEGRIVRMSGVLLAGGRGERPIHVDGGHLEVFDCMLEGYRNDAPILLIWGTLDCFNCSFVGNHVKDAGGAIKVLSGSLNVASSVFYNNSADAGGGAIFLSGSSKTNITDSVFNNNSDHGKLSVERSKFNMNAAHRGGAICLKTCDGGERAMLRDCSFDGNEARDSGGAVNVEERCHARPEDDGYLEQARPHRLVVHSSSFHCNQADNGAGMAIQDAAAHVTRSLFWRNEARHETSSVPSLVESCKFEHNVAHDAGSNLRFSDSRNLRLDGNSFSTENCDGDEEQIHARSPARVFVGIVMQAPQWVKNVRMLTRDRSALVAKTSKGPVVARNLSQTM
ncbi:hypothetical protein GUITHDRAFT_136237 [Guillardia theta CCMP2712]|uniref:Right handed beta helix domain-containing protein n=1 Tax=Guillardia theta (strain CCMP2712) TaxID=905079 RepID=L1JKJ5_GUITC|nr:hypothetical protein GUITHDRAFT_136237 [Guillardia theta CCMP2712]EKX49053.1 hypothetical protein GUITHDRAFT_136237 [Guillardia theta CCMP2712]|eukprot:XP_005836033.1 hypothetical protein GUITHDRAFT_136237 [Guillardia theta CCMP2712]